MSVQPQAPGDRRHYGEGHPGKRRQSGKQDRRGHDGEPRQYEFGWVRGLAHTLTVRPELVKKVEKGRKKTVSLRFFCGFPGIN